MNESKKLIAFMGGMIDQEKNSNFIRELEKESQKQGYFIVAFSFSETTAWDQDGDNCEFKLLELCSHLDIKAIVCANDAMAMACADELITFGYRVPEDIIVTGFDGVKSGYFNVPAITTVEPDYEDEARKIMSLMDKADEVMYSDKKARRAKRDT